MRSCERFLLVFLLLGQFLSSGTSSRPWRKKKQQELEHVNYVPEDHNHYHHAEAYRQISTTKRDITTPITTVPNLVPTTPTSQTPIMNPNSNPDVTVPPANTIPITASNSPPSSSSSLGSSWCVATPSASQTALQVALDYACGFGGADCSAIQPGGRCYNPNSIRDHASFAFNNYYQKNPVPNSCNFGGTAVITNTNPSTVTCDFPSTSTSSSILNTTNSIGANVFGSVPVPSTSQAFKINNGFSRILLLLPWLLASFLATKFL